MKQIITAMILVVVIGLFPIIATADTESEAKAEAHVNYAPVFEGNSKRGSWPGSAHSVHPTMPGNFAGVPQTHEPLDVERFMKGFKYEWNFSEVQNFIKEDDAKTVEIEARSVRTTSPSDKLKIVFPQVRPRGEMVADLGIVKGRSLKKNTSSEAVLGMIMSEALNMGGNVIVPLNEGAGRVLGASGWAVSLGYTHVVIGGAEGQAGVGGVGLGYASGQSSHRHDPFARFAVLHVPWDLYSQVLIFPEQLKKVAAAAAPEKDEKEAEALLIEKERNKVLQKKIAIEKEKTNYYKYNPKK